MMRRLALRYKRWMQPSLTKRLLLNQMLVTAVLWAMIMALLLYDAHDNPELLKEKNLYLTVAAIAHNLAGQPERQQETIRAFYLALLQAVSDGDGDELSNTAPALLVWQHGQLVYKSRAGSPGIANTRPDVIESVEDGGKSWRVRTLELPDQGLRIVMALPSIWRLALSITHSGFYLLPLLVSLPFLILPAWLSVYLALRPWIRVSKETAQRGLANLAPLTYRPPHKELRPLVHSINSLLHSVRASIVRERSLIADAAHELRTPLAAMRVNVEALKEQSVDARERELMDNLLRSNDRAARLVSQLLQLMRSDAVSDYDAPTVLSLDGLVQDRLAMIEGLAHVRDVELELMGDGGVFILGERESLVSMIDNLIDNAIKYSPAGGTVTVHVLRRQDQAVLRVCDQGPGIPPALHERVFNRFFRNPDQTQGGSGLGLAIVKSVADKHGASLRLDNALDDGGGLIVTVAWPLAPSGQSAPASA